MTIEWVVPNELYWSDSYASVGNKHSILFRVNPDGGHNKEAARVRAVIGYMNTDIEKYEALLVRRQYNPNTYDKLDPWSLGVLDTVQEAKDTVIAALVLNRLEGTENLTKGTK